MVVGKAHNILVFTEAYLRPEAAIFTCVLWPQDFVSHKSQENSGNGTIVLIDFSQPEAANVCSCK